MTSFARCVSCWLIRLLTLLFLPGVAAAGHMPTAFYGLTFPEQIAGAKIEQTTEYEGRAPGWGYSVKYEKPGWRLDVYIYDLGLASIPDGPASDALRQEMARSVDEIFAMQARGFYSEVTLRRDHLVHDASGRARLSCADYAFRHGSKGQVDSFLCLTGWGNKFLKFRLTSPRHPGAGSEAEQILAAWFGLLWP